MDIADLFIVTGPATEVKNKIPVQGEPQNRAIFKMFIIIIVMILEH